MRVQLANTIKLKTNTWANQLEQELGTRGPPMCIVRSAFIFCNIVSFCMMKSNYLLDKNVK
jgi:hypothetical protein